MPTLSDLHLAQTRHTWDDGTFSEATVLRFTPQDLAFDRIDQRERTVKLSNVAHLRAIKAQARGVIHPLIVLFAQLEGDCALSEAFPDVNAHTATGEKLYSANSLLTYTLRTLLRRRWLRYDGETWSPAVPDDEPVWQARAQAVLDLLTRDDRLYLGSTLGRHVSLPTTFESFDVRRDLIPVAPHGFVRAFVWRKRPRVAFNAAFFLLEHDDFFSHHSALGQAYNLHVRDGVILRPPLYRRAALYQAADDRWRVGRFSLADITITLPDGTTLVPEGNLLPGLPFTLNPESGAQVAVYTRACGLKAHGHPLRSTPITTNRVEFAVVNTRIVGRKTDGGLDIPQNGLVLSLAGHALPAGAIPDQGLPRLSYSFAQEAHRGIQQALQVGPMLLRDGQIVISETALASEEFWPTPKGSIDPADIGVVPTDYPDDVDRTRAGRIGIGVDAQGWLVVVAVPGTERGCLRPDADSAGATLVELAELLAQAGAVDAINLDGGGSTQLFYQGGLATRPGNRYGMPGVTFERMVPDVGVVW